MAATKSAAAAKPQTVLVLGGGIGGVATARRLRKRLDRQHRVVLVNRDPDFSLAASYLWVMSGERRAAQVRRPLHRLRKHGIDVVIGQVEGIDPRNHSATVDGRTIAADHLVVTLGADFTTEAVDGLDSFGHTFVTLPGAELLAARLQSFDRGRVLVVTAAPVYKCPAAPYESALLIDSLTRKRGKRSQVEIAVHSAEPGPMGVAGPNVSAAVKQILAERDIDYAPAHQITSVSDGTARFADGAEDHFDLLVYMPTIKSPAVLARSPLAGPGGWANADRNTLATSFSGVYAIGDNVQIPLRIGKPLPRAGVFAHRQAHAVADNIAAVIAGRAPGASFDGHGSCFIETGDGKAGYGSGDFYAEPSPSVTVKPPARHWHAGKVLLEKEILWRWV